MYVHASACSSPPNAGAISARRFCRTRLIADKDGPTAVTHLDVFISYPTTYLPSRHCSSREKSPYPSLYFNKPTAIYSRGASPHCICVAGAVSHVKQSGAAMITGLDNALAIISLRSSLSVFLRMSLCLFLSSFARVTSSPPKCVQIVTTHFSRMSSSTIRDSM